jgi:hypothetical protein
LGEIPEVARATAAFKSASRGRASSLTWSWNSGAGFNEGVLVYPAAPGFSPAMISFTFPNSMLLSRKWLAPSLMQTSR